MAFTGLEIGISTAFFEMKFSRKIPKKTKKGAGGRDLSYIGNSKIMKGEVLSTENLSIIKKSKIRNIELGPTFHFRNYSKGYLVHLSRQLDKYHINVHSFHGTIFTGMSLSSLDTIDREYILITLKRQIDTLGLFNPRIMVIHIGATSDEGIPTTKRQKEKCKMSLNELVHYSKDKNIKIAIENISLPNHIEYLLELLDDFDPREVGICLDTGHCHRLGEDLLQALELCKEKLITVHINDNPGKGSLDEHLLPYEGTINWKKFYKALVTNGYQGIFMYEPLHRPNIQEIFTKIKESFLKMKR